ncbi:MAG TPA: NHLP family bacteriocin export ABC transporter peptidase/permease/ATPase subunit [Candidatus Sulfotelmatobacter sp.]|nr:NHLP family bacteriocin export ABC transporter peptidase/permease/ATPase subunit [Candidatus Sulfotelmatobacter sp.]
MTDQADNIPRRRTPTVLQHEATECGAACLAMVLAHYGRWVSLEEMRHAAGVSRDGTKASNILRAAALYGLVARGASYQMADLRNAVTPAIIFWNFDHFVVLEGRRGDRFFINDPALGPRSVTAAEFDQAFTGIVLTFEPGPEFAPGGRAPSVVEGIKQRLRRFYSPIAAIVLAGFLLLVPGLVIPGLQRAFTDFYLVAGLHDWLWWLLGGMAGAAVLRMLLVWLQQYGLSRFSVRLGLISNGRLLWHILHMPMNFFNQRNSGELANRAALGDRLSSLMSGSLVIACVNLLAITVYGAVMLSYDLLLTLLAVAFAALEIALLVLMTRHLSNSHRRMLQEEAKLQSLLYQGFASIESFRASGTEDVFFRRWAGAHAKMVSAEQAMNRWRRLLNNLVNMLTTVTAVAIVLIGGVRVMEGTITVGMLVAFQTLIANFNSPVASFVGLGAQLQDTRGYIDRLDDVLRQKIDPLFAPDRFVAPLTHLRGRLQIEHVTFSYSGVTQPFFRDLNLTVPPGARIALVGQSGSGKSTLGRLIVGLALPQSGRILFDGVPIESIDNHQLRTSVAYVEQAVTLFPGTIRDNITMWDQTSTEERMVRAAKDAMLHEIIAARPNAYDSFLDEDGRNFSGGERQRLAIARALATDPVVLVLDEATNALDAVVEKQVLDNIRQRGCTCILISHRLSAINDCDDIIVLERGAIVEHGRHSVLHAKAGLYRRLVEA